MRGVSLVLFILAALPAISDEIRVAAAISLRDALTDIQKAYEAQTGRKVELTFGSSGQMLAQVRNGADIDLFIAAASTQVDQVIEEKLADEASRKTVVYNSLVVVVPPDSKLGLTTFAGLAEAPLKRLAVGEPRTVPAGQYAASALKGAGINAALAGRLIYGSNVRQVLSYVERGEVDAGIVYATDAKQAGNAVKVAAGVDAKLHEAIVYPAVIIGQSRNKRAAKQFLDFLATDTARKLFEARGFTLPETPPVGAER